MNEGKVAVALPIEVSDKRWPSVIMASYLPLREEVAQIVSTFTMSDLAAVQAEYGEEQMEGILDVWNILRRAETISNYGVRVLFSFLSTVRCAVHNQRNRPYWQALHEKRAESDPTYFHYRYHKW